MNEERAGREGSSRGSGGSWDGFGGSGGAAAGGGAAGEPAAVPRQAAPGQQAGPGRRRAGGSQVPEFGPGDLAAALQHSVAAIGAGGPPRAGLARIRRRAKARQRRRTVLAGSAGVLLLAVGVAAATGNTFNIVPVLTSVVGLGGHAGSSGATDATPDSGGPGQVRTVRPPAASVGKKGPAIGPFSPNATTAAALAATGVPQCTTADLKTVATVDSVIGGVSYGHIEAVANSACAVAGPPVLQVENAAGTAVGSVVILRHEASDGSALPAVPTWGAVLKLQVGQGYDLQFAWAPDSCTQSGANDPGGSGGGTSGASAGSSAAASGAATSGATNAAGNQRAQAAYSLSYLVAGVTPIAPVALDASCGATVYVTDIYSQGAYPLPQPPTTPTPQPPASSAPAPSQSATTQPPTSGAPTSASSSPAAPSSSATSSGPAASASSGSGPNSGASNAANATAAGSPSS